VAVMHKNSLISFSELEEWYVMWGKVTWSYNCDSTRKICKYKNIKYHQMKG